MLPMERQKEKEKRFWRRASLKPSELEGWILEAETQQWALTIFFFFF